MSTAPDPGVMRIHMRQAIFKRDTATFLDMDPHFVINWKDQKEVGEKAYGGGKCPMWNKSKEFNVGTDLKSAGVMTFSFMDGDNMICSIAMQCSALAAARGVDHWYTTRYEGEESGQVCINVEYQVEGEQEETIEEAKEELAKVATVAPAQSLVEHAG